jgi:predicted DNA-binding transcriptional regulator YafY
MAGKRNARSARSRGPITPARAARLYRLLQFLTKRPIAREELARTLKIDMRGFFRDLKTLRDLGVRVRTTHHLYSLSQRFEQAVTRLPFPDPRLKLNEAIQLAKGRTAAHRKLKRQIKAIVRK